MQPYNAGQYEEVFQKSVVDPSLQAYQQKILPAIQQRFVDANAGSSSALNQALAQSASDLTTALGSNYLNFFNQQQANQMAALGGLTGLGTQQTFQPIYSQSGGILGPLLQAGGMLGAATLSTKEAKENVEDFKDLGLDDVKKLQVKKYDYKPEFGGSKNRIGLIAEELPSQLTQEVDGKLHVDLYGLIAMVINAVQEIDEKIESGVGI